MKYKEKIKIKDKGRRRSVKKKDKRMFEYVCERGILEFFIY